MTLSGSKSCENRLFLFLLIVPFPGVQVVVQSASDDGVDRLPIVRAGLPDAVGIIAPDAAAKRCHMFLCPLLVVSDVARRIHAFSPLPSPISTTCETALEARLNANSAAFSVNHLTTIRHLAEKNLKKPLDIHSMYVLY